MLGRHNKDYAARDIMHYERLKRNNLCSRKDMQPTGRKSVACYLLIDITTKRVKKRIKCRNVLLFGWHVRSTMRTHPFCKV